jgi:hypothetical protein
VTVDQVAEDVTVGQVLTVEQVTARHPRVFLSERQQRAVPHDLPEQPVEAVGALLVVVVLQVVAVVESVLLLVVVVVVVVGALQVVAAAVVAARTTTPLSLLHMPTATATVVVAVAARVTTHSLLVQS